MNTQKIQTRGFTLVELIVVITILVILGTIAFINLGGQSASARDSKRTSDIRNLVSQVNIKQTGGVNFIDMVSSGSTYQISSGSLFLAGTGTIGTDYAKYQAGVPNYTLLGISPDSFKDPNKINEYAMAATSLVGGVYQIAATLEGDNAKTALVMGIYNARKATDYASGTVSNITLGTGTGYTVSLATGVGTFEKGDWIKSTGAFAGTGYVSAISSDLKTLTIINASTGATGGTGFVIATPETLGLIQANKTYTGGTISNTGVVNDSKMTLPW